MLAQDRFAPVLARHSMVNAGQVWDMDTGTLTFRLVDNAEGRKARAELTELHLPVRIRFETAARSTRELQAVAARLVATRDKWAPGLSGLGYTAPDEVRGRLVLGVLDRYVAEWRTAVEAADFGIPIVVRGEDQVGIDFQ